MSDLDDLLDNALSRQDEAAIQLAQALLQKKETKAFIRWLKETGKEVGKETLKSALPLMLDLLRGAVNRG